MSRIFKVEEVSSLPDIDEAEFGTLYMVKIGNNSYQRTMAYKSYEPSPQYVYVDSHEWLYLDQASTSGGTLPSIDITDYYDKFNEFLCVYTFNASATYPVSVEMVIPTKNSTPMANNRQDFMAGYYYDSSYNGSILFRLNKRTNSTKIQIISGFTKITGTGTTGSETLTIYAR